MSDEPVYAIRKRGGREYELTRRRFLELVAASAAVGYVGCSQNPSEKILPYTRQPLDVIPGVSTAYATSFAIDGYAMGLIAQTREGRPIKIDGHPEHPLSLGATSAFHQASVLQLYDPDRASAVLGRSQPASWASLLEVLQHAPQGSGEGLRLLLEPTSSPLVHSLLAAVKARYPESRTTFYAPLRSESDAVATQALFGRALTPQYDLSQVDCVVWLDSDLLATPYDLRHTRAFGDRRAPAKPSDEIARSYAIESALSVTGSMADHRLARPSRKVAPLTAALERALRGGRPEAPGVDLPEQRFVRAVAADLRARPHGRTLVVPGARQPPEVHVLAHGMNAALGNIDKTVRFTQPAIPAGQGDQALDALVAEMRAGKVELLVVLGGNPAYAAPADLEWADAMKMVKQSVYVGPYYNETGRVTQWFGPETHPYEQWSDGRAYDGTLSIGQPLIRPLRSGKSIAEILAALAQLPAASDFGRLRAQFGSSRGEAIDLARSEAERAQQEDPKVRNQWQEVVATGFERGSAFAAEQVAVRDAEVARAAATIARDSHEPGIELDLLPSPTLHDGRFANLGWLLELPSPVTKLTWDNAALVSPATATRLGLGPEAEATANAQPVIEIARGSRRLRVPVLIEPHQANDSVSLWLGYGREGRERLARGVGANAFELRTTAEPWFGAVQVNLLEQHAPLAITQREHDQHGRALAIAVSASHYRAHPDFTEEHKRPLPTLLEATSGSGPQWAMTIDLARCTGCSACMIACQAENNVLVVGKDQVLRGREMHWLRIDTYTSSRSDSVVHQPMLCQHCEKAPCEYVCPVNATVHSPDGLNEMVYNRCVGTRFCSNNCPYKVRRFNWFDWVEEQAANRGQVELQRNPEVSVRERGVMEKCTYCVQRIRGAEIAARKERRPIRVAEVMTACQQACASGAISFGSLHDGSEMVTRRQDPRSYAALHDTNAAPRTMYLARVDNPNPELES